MQLWQFERDCRFMSKQDFDPREFTARLNAGNPEAWKDLDNFIKSSLKKISWPSVRGNTDEIAGDVAGIIWEALKSLRDSRKLFEFAFAITRRQALRRYREAQRLSPIESSLEFMVSDLPSKNCEVDELLQSITENLSNADRKLFRLLFVAGRSSKDIGAELCISRESLRKRKQRLLEKVRQRILSL